MENCLVSASEMHKNRFAESSPDLLADFMGKGNEERERRKGWVWNEEGKGERRRGNEKKCKGEQEWGKETKKETGKRKERAGRKGYRPQTHF